MPAPFPDEPPVAYRALPDYIIEDIAEFLLFTAHFHVSAIEKTNMLPIMHLFMALVANPKYLSNPYLRSKLVEVFCALAKFPTAHGDGAQSLVVVFERDPFLVENLVPALVRLFVSIKSTSSDSYFYDKFNVRHAIAVLLKFLHSCPQHAAQTKTLTENVGDIMRFLDCVMNDFVYLMDETLLQAGTAHALQAVTPLMVSSVSTAIAFLDVQ
jgi:ubiquitin conjugation factor E4 B